MVYTANINNSMPIPTEPGVLSCYVANSAGTSDVLVYVPWKNCRLAYAYSVVVAKVDTAAGLDIDLELNAAGGGDIMSIAHSASDAIGTVAEATFDDSTLGMGLDRDDSTKDAVNIEMTGTNATGAVMVYMYFEPEVGQ